MMVLVWRQAGKLGERGCKAEQADGFFADTGARAGRQARGALGHAQDERHAGAHAPCGEFLPVLFFAEMPAVIGPERDDGVVGVGPFLQSIEHVAEHGVGKVNGGEVTLHGRFPLLVLTDVGEVPVGPAAFALGREIIQIIGLVTGRQLDGFQRERREIFLGHKPRLVRSVDTAGEEERFIVFSGQLFADPLGHQHVAAVFLIRGLQRRPVGLDILPRLPRNAHRAFLRIQRKRERIFRFLFREILIPRLGVDKVMQHLARTGGPVPGAGEGLGQQLCLGQNFAHALVVGIQPGTMRRLAGEDCRARWITRRCRAMGVGEEHARSGQTIEVGCASLRVTAEATDPVVQIINGDEEDVGLGGGERTHH